MTGIPQSTYVFILNLQSCSTDVTWDGLRNISLRGGYVSTPVLPVFVYMFCSPDIVVQSLSRVRLFATAWAAARQASLSFTISRSLLKFMSIESVMLSYHLTLCHTLLLLPSIFPNIRGSFPMSRLFSSGGQSTGASASASVLPMSIQGWFPLRWTSLISLLSKGLSRVLYSTTIWKHQFVQLSAFFNVQLSHPYMTTRKTISKVMSLLLNILSRFVIAFLPKSKHLLISWLQSPSAVILKTNK